MRSVTAGALLALGALTHCDRLPVSSLHAVLEGAGVEDAPVGEPIDLQVLCDPSEGSVCEPGTASLALERLARVVFRHPGSDLTVTLQGDRPADTRRLGSITVPPPVDRGERAARAAEDRFVAAVRAAVCPPLDAALAQPRPRQSPIAEALDEVALSKSSTRRVALFVLTDLREVSALGDFECARALPTVEAFQARLERHHLLAPGTLARTRVHIVTGDHGPVPRRQCPVSMGREREVQTLWRAALLEAGAETVTFHAEVPSTDVLVALLASPTPPASNAGLTAGRTR